MVKYLTIFDNIKNSIDEGAYAFGCTIPTEKELSEQFDVSRIVIRMAVDKLEKLGYLQRKAGFGTVVTIDTSEKKTNKVFGVIFSFLASSFGASILLSIEQEARRKGYNIIFKNSDNNPQSECERLKELFDFGVAGIIMQPAHNEKMTDGLDPFIENKIPVVLIDRDLQSMNLSFVGTDSILETKNSVNKLFMSGYKNLGLISQDIASATSLSERVKGFKLAHEKVNFPFSADKILSDIKSIAFYTTANYQNDKQSIKEFLEKNRCDCILTTELAVGRIVSDVISENEQFSHIAIATFDRSETPLKYVKYHILQNQYEMGEKAVSMLLSQIKNGISCIKQFVATDFVSF